jgi:anti-sigma regulatory factor (Ser/Thr protein kinase)
VAQAQIPNRLDSAPAARSFLTRLLDGWGVAQRVIDDASLLTSELMANAVQHGSGVVSIRIELVDDGKLCVGVHDDADDLPAVRQVDVSSPDGRGLWIVQSVADQWGAEPSEETAGKTVWFELRLLPEPTA